MVGKQRDNRIRLRKKSTPFCDEQGERSIPTRISSSTSVGATFSTEPHYKVCKLFHIDNLLLLILTTTNTTTLHLRIISKINKFLHQK